MIPCVRSCTIAASRTTPHSNTGYDQCTLATARNDQAAITGGMRPAKKQACGSDSSFEERKNYSGGTWQQERLTRTAPCQQDICKHLPPTRGAGISLEQTIGPARSEAERGILERQTGGLSGWSATLRCVIRGPYQCQHAHAIHRFDSRSAELETQATTSPAARCANETDDSNGKQIPAAR